MLRGREVLSLERRESFVGPGRSVEKNLGQDENDREYVGQDGGKGSSLEENDKRDEHAKKSLMQPVYNISDD